MDWTSVSGASATRPQGHAAGTACPAAASPPETSRYLAAAERGFRLELPAAYKRFVRSVERHDAEAVPGLILDCDRLLACREAAEYLLRDSRAERPLDRFDFVFLFQGRFRFFLFRCDEGPNPPVYRFAEGERRPRHIADSFTDWLRLPLAAARS